MDELIERTPAQASFVLTAGLVFDLRQEAKRRGVSVSELVRNALTDALAGYATLRRAAAEQAEKEAA